MGSKFLINYLRQKWRDLQSLFVAPRLGCACAQPSCGLPRYMIEQAPVDLWTLVSSCSHRKVKHWKTFHQHMMLWCSISKGSAYQAGHVWSPCLLMDPGNCGWTMVNNCSHCGSRRQ